MPKVAATEHRRRAQPGTGRGNETPLLTVIVPVYNEVRTIDEDRSTGDITFKISPQ